MKTPKNIFILSTCCVLVFISCIFYSSINENSMFVKPGWHIYSQPPTNMTCTNKTQFSIPESSSNQAVSSEKKSSLPIKNNNIKQQTIFFMETSGKSNLNGRQACAVESAAKQNPNMNITLYFISPTLNLSDTRISVLSQISNVRFQYLNLNSFFNHTPLELWFKTGEWKKSPYKISHMSDALRFLTLWKFGGIYLDLDVVVMKSLEDLKNCAGKESETNVAAGVMAFDRHHSFLTRCLKDFAVNYNGKDWGYNGPKLITRVLKRECGGIKNIKEISRKKCKGVTALSPDAFYAIPWPEWKKFFDSENSESVMDVWKNSYLIHVWNKHSINTPVIIGSDQPYDQVARKYCPLIYQVISKDGSF